MSAVNVGQVGSFGLSKTQALAQIWQILLDARSGAFPLNVTTSGPSGSAPDGIARVGLVGSYGMGETDYILQILQMLIDSRTGAVPLVVASV